MKCPVCAHIFAPVTAEEAPPPPPEDDDIPIKLADEPEAPKPAPEPPKGKGKGKGGKGPPAPPDKKKKKDDDDEDTGPANYSIVEEKKDDDENKPEIHYGSLRDKFAKSKIGPAQFRTVRPSNWLLRLGLFSCVMGLLTIVISCWPIIFSMVTPSRVFIRSAMDYSLVGLMQFCCGAIICYGASKMHDLTSWTFSLVGSIVACLFYTPFGVVASIFSFLLCLVLLGPFGFPLGIFAVMFWVAMACVGYWCIITLLRKEVREGFAERSQAGGVQER